MTKRDQIIALLASDMSASDIAATVGCDDAYVYAVRSSLRDPDAARAYRLDKWRNWYRKNTDYKREYDRRRYQANKARRAELSRAWRRKKKIEAILSAQSQRRPRSGALEQGR